MFCHPFVLSDNFLKNSTSEWEKKAGRLIQFNSKKGFLKPSWGIFGFYTWEIVIVVFLAKNDESSFDFLVGIIVFVRYLTLERSCLFFLKLKTDSVSSSFERKTDSVLAFFKRKKDSESLSFIRERDSVLLREIPWAFLSWVLTAV